MFIIKKRLYYLYIIKKFLYLVNVIFLIHLIIVTPVNLYMKLDIYELFNSSSMGDFVGDPTSTREIRVFHSI